MASDPVTIATIAASLSNVRSVSLPNTVVSSITHDSRRVRSGSLFIAIAGMASDGHAYIDRAVASGAVGVLVERDVNVDVAKIVVDDTRKAMPWAARTVHHEPDSDLEIIGITGTNGKTTVAHMCESIWAGAGWKSGLIGTLGARIAGKAVTIERTTPEATDLQALLGSMRDVGVDAVAMEVSSHALDLHRADAIRFEIAAFTNLTQDHLDFHGDMDAYYGAKASLFTRARARRCVINIDDAHGARLYREVAVPCLSVGTSSSADVQIRTVAATASGTEFQMAHDGESLTASIPLIGAFNVANAGVAAAIAISEHIDLSDIARGLATVPTIPGRMEVIEHAGPFTVVVDYAHTPDAIAEVLRAGSRAADGRVIAVIGAAGDRDRDKRALMGAASARLADMTIITSDNPRGEDPASIASEVRRGADAVAGSAVQTIIDRREAIDAAITEASARDIVLILGKGHEQGIEIEGTVTAFDDRSEARSALRRHGLEPRS